MLALAALGLGGPTLHNTFELTNPEDDQPRTLKPFDWAPQPPGKKALTQRDIDAMLASKIRRERRQLEKVSRHPHLKQLHAWYSKSAARLHGSLYYGRKDGTKAEVTEVNERNEPTTVFPDLAYIGLVNHQFLGQAQRGSMDQSRFICKA